MQHPRHNTQIDGPDFALKRGGGGDDGSSSSSGGGDGGAKVVVVVWRTPLTTHNNRGRKRAARQRSGSGSYGSRRLKLTGRQGYLCKIIMQLNVLGNGAQRYVSRYVKNVIGGQDNL